MTKTPTATARLSVKSWLALKLAVEGKKAKKSWFKNWDLYLLLIPVLAYFVVFHYIPMYGAQIAFRDFNPVLGFSGSPWVGLAHFERFVRSFFFERVIVNTLRISLYLILVGFPIPIILAIMLNELRSQRFRKFIQMLTYAPHFLSVVVVVGLISLFFNPRTGIVNHATDSDDNQGRG